MDQVRRLRELADKAERLAKSALDATTIERLLSYSAEMRHEARQIETDTPTH